MNMNDNIILATDSYKPSHWLQYPEDTEQVYSFFESRGGEFPQTVFFGLQYIMLRHLVGQVVNEEKIGEARELFAQHYGTKAIFNEKGWQYLLREYGGRLPVRIRAVPEGSVVPAGNVLVTVENTDRQVPWLTNYIESILSQVWYPTTVATQSASMRADILKALQQTGDPSLVDFKLHDFGYRGSTSDESAGIGGLAHLVNFMGTDTLSALRLGRAYYDTPMAGFSIPASEHSTITSWGREHEVDAYRNMLTQFPEGLVAVVSDSYDIYQAVQNLWGGALKSAVMARNGTLVVRPDSGEPAEVVVKVLSLLGETFGYAVNSKGFKVLDPHVRVIQGDGIDRHSIPVILNAMIGEGWSADNVAFGSGGGLLQKVNRDTAKFAFKCSAVKRGGGWQDVLKDPVTDPGKKGKAGRLKLIDNGSGYQTVREGHSRGEQDLLVPVFENGELLKRYTLADVRAKARADEARKL